MSIKHSASVGLKGGVIYSSCVTIDFSSDKLVKTFNLQLVKLYVRRQKLALNGSYQLQKGGDFGAKTAVSPQMSQNRMDDCGERLKQRGNDISAFSEFKDFNCNIATINVTIHKTYTLHYLVSVFNFFNPVIVPKHENSVHYDQLQKKGGKRKSILIKTKFNSFFLPHYNLSLYPR